MNPILHTKLCDLTGIDFPIRAESARITAGAIGAVTTVWLPFSDTFAELTSPPASKSPRSEGLIGVASTRTITSSFFGGDTVT